MLCLDRFRGQRIKIGDEITVTVLKVANGHIEIGVDAPKSMTIRRKDEVFKCDICGDEIYKENTGQITAENVLCIRCLRRAASG